MFNLSISLLKAPRMGLALMLAVIVLAGSAYAGGGPPPLPAPEIDPGSIGGALTLLIGGAFLLTGRSRKG
jgi:hypothetical protein